MYAVILAGGKIDPGNELFAESKGLPKSMIDIHGKPMIQWVIDAANKAGSVEKLIITGLDSIEGLKSAKPVLLIPDQQGILENLAAAAIRIVKEAPGTAYFLSVSADIPLITPEIIETVIARSHESGFDVFYNVVEKNVMEAAFPDVKRTYMHFREGRFCGADMHVMSTKAMEKMIAAGFVKYRKRPVKLITMAGVATILRMLFYPYSLKEAENVVLRKTGIIGKAVVCQTPGLAMDIDTLQHLRIVREKLAQQIANE